LGNEVNCQEKEGTMLKPLEIPPLTEEELEALEKLYRTTKQPVEKLHCRALRRKDTSETSLIECLFAAFLVGEHAHSFFA
jgi:hypothetical protein